MTGPDLDDVGVLSWGAKARTAGLVTAVDPLDEATVRRPAGERARR